jgi:hypothetical protein
VEPQDDKYPKEQRNGSKNTHKKHKQRTGKRPKRRTAINEAWRKSLSVSNRMQSASSKALELMRALSLAGETKSKLAGEIH